MPASDTSLCGLALHQTVIHWKISFGPAILLKWSSSLESARFKPLMKPKSQARSLSDFAERLSHCAQLGSPRVVSAIKVPLKINAAAIIKWRQSFDARCRKPTSLLEHKKDFPGSNFSSIALPRSAKLSATTYTWPWIDDYGKKLWSVSLWSLHRRHSCDSCRDKSFFHCSHLRKRLDWIDGNKSSRAGQENRNRHLRSCDNFYCFNLWRDLPLELVSIKALVVVPIKAALAVWDSFRLAKTKFGFCANLIRLCKHEIYLLSDFALPHSSG